MNGEAGFHFEPGAPGAEPVGARMRRPDAKRDPDAYLAMGLLMATVLSSLFGFTAEAGPLAATLGQTAFLLFGAALLLVAGRLWLWPENPEEE